mgnify:CR=1 FL=1
MLDAPLLINIQGALRCGRLCEPAGLGAMLDALTQMRIHGSSLRTQMASLPPPRLGW